MGAVQRTQGLPRTDCSSPTNARRPSSSTLPEVSMQELKCFQIQPTVHVPAIKRREVGRRRRERKFHQRPAKSWGFLFHCSECPSRTPAGSVPWRLPRSASACAFALRQCLASSLRWPPISSLCHRYSHHRCCPSNFSQEIDGHLGKALRRLQEDCVHLLSRVVLLVGLFRAPSGREKSLPRTKPLTTMSAATFQSWGSLVARRVTSGRAARRTPSRCSRLSDAANSALTNTSRRSSPSSGRRSSSTKRACRAIVAKKGELRRSNDTLISRIRSMRYTSSRRSRAARREVGGVESEPGHDRRGRVRMRGDGKPNLPLGSLPVWRTAIPSEGSSSPRKPDDRAVRRSGQACVWRSVGNSARSCRGSRG